jgi:4-hydroxy-3-methylbut-2-enyl diphosphate reductase
VDIVRIALDLYPGPLYVRKEIVHNPHVVDELRNRGVVFVNELWEVPDGARVIFSAHGVSPQVWDEARAKRLQVIDATCPLVTKVHLEARKFAASGHTIVFIGHAGHEEVEGTMGEAPDHMVLVTSVEDVRRLELPDPDRLIYLTQTTLSLDDTRQIVDALQKRFPKIQNPPTEDICYATQNRQEAVRELARLTDLILVVGARNSSNSNRLVEEAQRHGCPAHLINDVGSIEAGWLQGRRSVGLTSGASAPERLVEEVVAFFRDRGARIETLVTREETVQFALPANLRKDMLPVVP